MKKTILMPIFCLFPFLTWGENSPPIGEISNIEGVVLIRKDNQSGKTQVTPAKVGSPVSEGDIINTASDGKVKILLADKSILDLGPSTLFKVSVFKKNQGPDRQVDLDISYGSIRSAIAQKITGEGRFKVKTPTATMGVRGTEFVVHSEIGDLKTYGHLKVQPSQSIERQKNEIKTQITVLQGLVAVTPQTNRSQSRNTAPTPNPKVVELPAGTQISTIATIEGKATSEKPIILDQNKLSEISKESKFQDNTFSKSVMIDTDTTSSTSKKSTSQRNPASANSSSYSSSSGTSSATPVSNNATLSVVNEVITSSVATTAPTINLNHLGFSGAINPIQSTNSINNVITQNSKKTLKILISK